MKKDLKEKAIELRKQGISIVKIGKELGVAKSSVSVWTRDISLTPIQKNYLLTRVITSEQALAHTSIFRVKRQQYQERGRERIKCGDPLYVAGCMLYWGEGTKSVNKCELVNSELPLLLIFKQFLTNYFNVSVSDIRIRINAYTDLHSEEDIKKYWLTGLELPETALKSVLWNQYPSSSKKISRRSEYGTCELSILKTEIVQEIYGAIQEFSSFINPNWLG